MIDYRAPLDDMRFVLFDVLQAEAQWQSLEGLEEVDRGTADAILDEAARLCEQVVAPLNRVGDEQGCRFADGSVTTAEGFKEAYAAFSQGGWGALGGNPQWGGMGMPKALVSAVEEMLQGACMSFGLAPMLTAGACLALDAHGSELLKQQYLEKMYSGEWAGAMALTEPHAGTDLGLLSTKAEPQGDGSYRITGTKIFITWGEHDMSANIVHLVLAKIPGAPDGTRGISMFLVPKYLPDEQGGAGKRNSLACGSLEKKMGIKGSATCVMNYDGAQGWLVGEANRGLACMFTMMNYERLVVGIQAVAAAQWSYENAKAYALDRRQGRSLKGVDSDAHETDAIIVHPDIRRMLMTAKALNEGGRAFYVYVAQWLDRAKFSPDPEQTALAQNRVALLTPIAKAFISDMAFATAVDCQQVFGGHGYVREWGQEQFVRDIRITQIYEGTNGVQAMDLMGRKTVATEGALLAQQRAEIDAFMAEHKQALRELTLYEGLHQCVAVLGEVTDVIIVKARNDADEIGAAATEYLHLSGYVLYAYMWAKMAVVAAKSDTPAMRAKMQTAQFYFAKILPRIYSLRVSITQGSSSIMALEEEQF